MTDFVPDTPWKGILLAFVVLCGVVSTVAPVYLKVKKIDTQVSNQHEENMRDEITRGFGEVREDIRGLHKDHLLLREEIRTERQERIEGDRQREVA